jgi:hypothetical protein
LIENRKTLLALNLFLHALNISLSSNPGHGTMEPSDNCLLEYFLICTVGGSGPPTQHSPGVQGKKTDAFSFLNSIDFKGDMKPTGNWWHLLVSEKTFFSLGAISPVVESTQIKAPVLGKP